MITDKKEIYGLIIRMNASNDKFASYNTFKNELRFNMVVTNKMELNKHYDSIKKIKRPINSSTKDLQH